jgi:hypothetical protein
MNKILHMTTYALNPKWYMERFGRNPPIDDPKIEKEFQATITKMYDADEG